MKAPTACVLAAVALLTAALSIEARAQSNQNVGKPVKTVAAGIHILQVRDNVYMLTGSGGNITVMTFPQGVLVVDTGLQRTADQVLAAIRELSGQPIAHIVNTSADPDHVGGNERLSVSGRRIPRDIIAAASASGGAEGPMIVAHENVLKRMSAPTGSAAPAPVRAWPTDP